MPHRPPPKRIDEAVLRRYTHIQILDKRDVNADLPKVPRGRPRSHIAELPRGVYESIPILRSDKCQHRVSLCITCVDIWQQTHHVRTFEHGTSTGYGSGCSCDRCKAAVREYNRQRYYIELQRRARREASSKVSR